MVFQTLLFFAVIAIRTIAVISFFTGTPWGRTWT
jgi:hypothetical protein